MAKITGYILLPVCIILIVVDLLCIKSSEMTLEFKPLQSTIIGRLDFKISECIKVPEYVSQESLYLELSVCSKDMKIKVIITGSTGMVGEGVLHVCLADPRIEKILVLNRKSCGISDPKLIEIIHDNFFDLSSIESDLSGYDACFYCLGVTSLTIKEPEYYQITYTLTLSIAQILSRLNPWMTFCYISGAGVGDPEKAKFMQARVKGKTEKDLFKLTFKNTYSFRPGLIKPMKGLKHTHTIYYLFNPLYEVFRLILPGFVSTLEELGQAMINSVLKGSERQILEVKDIIRISKQD